MGKTTVNLRDRWTRTFARVALYWPFLMIAGMELAMRATIWHEYGRLDLRLGLSGLWWGGWLGYRYLRHLQAGVFWGALASIGIALASKSWKPRVLAMVGLMLDVAIFTYADGIRF